MAVEGELADTTGLAMLSIGLISSSIFYSGSFASCFCCLFVEVLMSSLAELARLQSGLGVPREGSVGWETRQRTLRDSDTLARCSVFSILIFIISTPFIFIYRPSYLSIRQIPLPQIPLPCICCISCSSPLYCSLYMSTWFLYDLICSWYFSTCFLCLPDCFWSCPD